MYRLSFKVMDYLLPIELVHRKITQVNSHAEYRLEKE